MTRVADLLAALEIIAPARLAEPWDNIGLIIGDADRKIESVAFSLDPTEQTVEAARKSGAQALVSHHPLFFKEVKSVTGNTPQGRTALLAAKHQIAVICAHTNLDAAGCGTAQTLARLMELGDVKPLENGPAAASMKLVTFIPQNAVEKLAEAVFRAGAGVIGEYGKCSFRVEGTGTFLPSKSAKPAVGESGKLNQVPEVRFETVIPARAKQKVVDALIAAHPYEEPAFDLYPLLGYAGGLGQGRIGTLPETMTLEQLGKRVRRILKADVRIALPKGSSNKKLRRLAVAPGSGSFALPLVPKGGDCALLTGELNYHNGQDAWAMGVPLVLAGHFGTEFPAVREFAAAVSNEMRNAGHEVRCNALTCESDFTKVLTDD